MPALWPWLKAGELKAYRFIRMAPARLPAAIALIKDIKAGKTVEKEVTVPFVLVTSANVGDYLK